MYRYWHLGILACGLYAMPAIAEDPRSISLGGSVIANAKGAHGALANPASMMAMQRRDEALHLRFGISGEVRDTGSAVDTLTDEANEDLISDIDNEINALSQTNIECNPLTGQPDDICISGTQPLSDLSGRLLDIIDLVDNETLDAQLRADFGIAFTRMRYPLAFHLRTSASGAGRPDIADTDRDYIQEFQTVLDGDEITLGEAQNSTFLQVDEFGVPLAVTQPEDVLESMVEGSTLLRAQLGVSIATTFEVADHEVDIGITPKFSSLTAYRSDVSVRDEFIDGAESASDRFEDSEVSESSFTFDLGGSFTLTHFSQPVQLAAVLKNVIPESIKTTDGFAFDTDPQLIVGAAMQAGPVMVNGDLALNAAKVDNFETQKLSLGVEYEMRWLAVRGGINHDASRDDNATALSLGLKLGPFELGGRLTGTESLEAGMQLAMSFR